MRSRALASLLAAAAVAVLPAAGATTVRGAVVSVTAPGATCNVMDYGAHGDGVTDDTKALQAAIDACSDGGTALLPEGKTFMSYALTATKPSSFVLSVGGTLRFFNDTRTWPQSATFCITFAGGSGVAITGGGLVDGNGYAWWALGKSAFRPGLVLAQNVDDLLITGVDFRDSPNHQLELFANNMEVYNVTITAPGCDQLTPSKAVCGHNTDGIDVHGQPAYIHDAFISTGDDLLAFHANDTLVERMTFGRGHGASIGSLGKNTYLQNITVRDCTFNSTESAVRIKADPGSTGFLRDVTYENLAMTDVAETILLTQFYGSVPPAGPVTTIAMSDITFRNITSRDASQQAGQFLCAASAPCTGITVADVTHTGTPPPKGWQCWNVTGPVTKTTPVLDCFGSGGAS